MHTRLGRLHRIELVVNRRSRASEIVNFVDLDIKRESHVVPNQFKIRIPNQVCDVVFATGKEIVNAQNVIPSRKQSFTQV
jgi:hypothetical protein